MAETIIARVFGDQQDICEWATLSDSAMISPHQGDLNELASTAKHNAVILLLPATEVVLITLDLPITSPRQLKQALPYALEDYLAHDVESYHWTWRKQPGGKVAVAAIEHRLLASYLQRCRNAGLKLLGVYAETLFLPVQDDRVSVLLDRGRAIVRYTQWQGGGVDQDFLVTCLVKTLANTPTQIRLWHTQDCGDLQWPQELTSDTEAIPSALALLRPDKDIGLNLLTGVYNPEQPGTIRWQAWIPAATLLLLAVSLQFGMAFKAYRHSQVQLVELETANRQLFTHTFPHIKRIVNIKAQAEQELLGLRKHQGGNHSAFLRLLYQSGAIISQDSSLQLQALEFANGILSLHLTGSSIAQIEQFKQRMEQNQQVSVNIQSAETDNKGVSAHIDISGQTS
ncbi:MAG: type II secretion system protein GspL [Methylovulum sp.]|nr:type II secretion system protein GspL [Methylovulum sp.]